LGELADPTLFTGPLDVTGEDLDELVDRLRRMILIRAVEEAIGSMVSTGEVKCPCHLAIGQEAAAVGVTSTLRPTDRIFGAHRSHAHFLALGGEPAALLAEVLGRAAGCSGGMGGSMHLIDRSRGLYGTVPIVAATISIATGAALAAKKDGRGDVAVSFFGDGATEEGSFHESLNMAAVMQLPIIFVCENNLFSSHLHIDQRQPFDSVARYASSHGVMSETVEANDVVAVAHTAQRLVERARHANAPSFLEAVTYRWRGHVGSREDVDVGLRRREELNPWKQRDPIARLARALTRGGRVRASDLRRLANQVSLEVSEALEEARSSPYPTEDTLLDTVYAGSSK
jgi:pyruvate dehydrogenase E1 component alpha subunit